MTATNSLSTVLFVAMDLCGCGGGVSGSGMVEVPAGV